MLVSRTAGGVFNTVEGKFGPSCVKFHLLVSRTAGGDLDTQNGRVGGNSLCWFLEQQAGTLTLLRGNLDLRVRNSICWFQEQQAGTLTLKMGEWEEIPSVGFKNSRRGP